MGLPGTTVTWRNAGSAKTSSILIYLSVYAFETRPFPGFAPGPTQGMVGNTGDSRRETGGIRAMRQKVGMPMDANSDSSK